jgi:uncharacterized lipoprotein YehR (DUF1307 family)
LSEEKISATLKYTVKEMAGENVKTTYQDEYSLEDFEIKLSTYISPWNVDSS